MDIAIVSASIWFAANLLAEWKYVSLTAVGVARGLIPQYIFCFNYSSRQSIIFLNMSAVKELN